MQTQANRTGNATDRVARALKIAADTVANDSGKNIFRELVINITQALDVAYAYIGKVRPGEADVVDIIAGYFGDGIVENSHFNLEGTPCKNVVNQVYRYYPENVAALFGDDSMAADLNVESYAAIPLYDSNGKGMGIMSIMDTKPLTEPELVKSLLQIFSVRAAVELEKLSATKISEATQEQYKTIFNKSLDGLILFSLDGRIVDMNPAWLDMHGYTRDEALHLRPLDFVPRESHEVYKQFISTVGKNQPFHTVANGLRKDGSRYLADVRGVQMDYQGSPHMLAILRDVTEQVEHENALRKSEDRLRSTINAAMDCIIGIDPDGNVLEFNPAAEETFGFAKSEIVGKPMADLIIPDHYREQHSIAMNSRKQAVETKNLAKRMEVTAMRADGSEFPVELSIDVAQGAEGKMFIGYLRDITERKQAEEQRLRLEAQLRQSQKMEAIGHLSGGIAHDFNNILTGVMGYIVLALEKSEQYGDEKIAKYLTRSLRSGQKARDLIQQMLTFSRGQRGEPKPLVLTPIVKESIKLLESTLPSTIEIKTDCDYQLPQVNVDPVHIEQIIMNLCINARDAMQSSGKLTISAKQQHCSNCICSSCQQSIEGDFIELVVSDTGVGIQKDEISRIFEPFYSTKEVGKGSGMGLSTVHGIVHEYGGHIGVESNPGRGTSFHIFIPPIKHETDSTGDDTEDNMPGNSTRKTLHGRVLLVDDELSVSEFMEDMLEEWGIDVYTFTNSLKAKEFVEANPEAFDLIILDQTMPGLTGIELARHVVGVNPHVPIILYTGYSEEIAKSDIEILGIQALVKKPIDVEDFYQLTKSVLHSAR
ncbi:hybrid sensor histidine kinase/response regulator [Kaarinaea lacus]